MSILVLSRFSLLVSAGLMFSLPTTQADILGTYTFDGGDNSTNQLEYDVEYDYGVYPFDTGGDTKVPEHPNAIFGKFEFHNIGGYSWPDLLSPNKWTAGSAMDSDEYLQFVITPVEGYSLYLENISFNHLADFGPTNNAIRIFRGDLDLGNNPESWHDQDFFESELAVGDVEIDLVTLANTTYVFDFDDFQGNVDESVTVRFYGWNSELSPGVLALDNVAINGAAVPEPAHIALGVFGTILGGARLALWWRRKRLSRIA